MNVYFCFTTLFESSLSWFLNLNEYKTSICRCDIDLLYCTKGYGSFKYRMDVETMLIIDSE